MLYHAAIIALSLAVRPVVTQSKCNVSAFSSFVSANVSVERVVQVVSGASFGEGIIDLAYPLAPTNLPELCAVIIHVVSSPSSAYRFCLFLPTDWNARFLAVGNGGFGGGINWLDMGAGVHYGFAVVSTDTGHNSTTTNSTWALNQPEKKIDSGWRAMHGSVTLGKQIIEAYYGHKIAFSYYNGCSTGGRQGLKEIEVSPDSFDGVVVGASAWYPSHLNPWVTKVGMYNLPFNASNHIDAKLFPAMATEVVKQCDGLDGVQDGIISMPSNCDPDYTKLLCSRPNANSSTCLTEAQIATARKVYADYVSSNGTLLYPGLTPGCENQWALVLNYTDTSPFGIGYIRNFLYDDPSWYWTQYDDSVLEYADRADPGDLSVTSFDLSEFRNRGSKLIMHHGLADGLVPPKGSEWFYKLVAQEMANGDVTELYDFFRYFEVPGMGHCYVTYANGPWSYAGGSQASALGTSAYSVPGFEDAEHDVLLAMMRWVENDTAVDSVIATTWRNQLDPSTPVAKQRPLCPYPQVALYNGSGDVDKAISWRCGNLGNSTGAPTSIPTPAPTTVPIPGIACAPRKSALLLPIMLAAVLVAHI